MHSSLSSRALRALVLLSLGSVAFAQTPVPATATLPEITQDNVIVGTMDIDFTTRTNLDTTGDLKKGSPALGAKDTYKLDITVANAAQFTGSITRQPKTAV